ncbi:MAG: hypothetical protein IJC73_08800, partial [Lentisphaeria bacterium]|nr:hypothetical protein [Lentisphaeria bacterium]
MADYYLTVNGEYFDEAGDFNDGIDYVFECRNEGVDAVLCVTGGSATPLTGTEFYLKGASTTITGGVITGWVYCGFNSVSSEEVIKSQEIILDGGTISGNLSLGSHSGDSYVENVTLTVKSGIITGQILTGNTGHVGDVTMNLLGGDLRNTISCTAMAGTGKTGNVVVNFDGYSNAARWVHAAYRGSAESVTINVKQGHLHLMNLGAGLAGAVATMPVTLNLTGGTINNICLNYTATSALIGDVTVNMSGGVVNTNFRMGNWSQGAADFVESTGTTTINLTGGSVNTDIYGGGTAIHKGDVVINISGTYHSSKIIYAGAPNGPGMVDGNTTITVSGGTWEGSSYWLMGGGKYGKTTGKATINIQEGANVYHIFGGGREAGSDVLGGVEINVSGGEIHGVCQGAGYRSNIEGGVNINVTGGTFCRDMKANYWVAGYIIGGASNALPVIKGDINISVSGAVVHGGILGGSIGGTIEGNITMNISGITVGTVSDGVVDGGGITIFADNQAEIIGNATATITDVTAYGNLYISTTGANYIEGDTTVTVANSSFANIALEKGYFFEEVNEETGEITIGETRETEINGNVLFDLTNVTVSGNVYGQSLKLNLVKFSEEGQGATLAVSGKL